MTRCSFCGLKDDPRTALGFASEWNLCHHASPVAPPNLAHQDTYCLSDKHTSCPVFLLAEKKPLPKQVVYRGRKNSPRENVVFFRVGLSFLFLSSVLIGIVAIIIQSYPGNQVPQGTVGVDTSFSTAAVSSSLQPTITVDRTVEPTGTLPSTAMVCTPPAGWIPYQVAPADTMERLHVFYGIKVAELESANCLEKGYVLQAGDQIYIPPLQTNTPLFRSPTLTSTVSPTPTPSREPIIYYTVTPTKEENGPRPPTPVPPTRTPAPTMTPAPVVPTAPPVPPTPTSPPLPTSPPPTSPPSPGPSASPPKATP